VLLECNSRCLKAPEGAEDFSFQTPFLDEFLATRHCRPLGFNL
jgi:hypothetical protein